MLVINDIYSLYCSPINEEGFRHGTGRENTNTERCTKNLSTEGKKDKLKETGRQSKCRDRKGRKTPAFHHLEHTCLILLMWQNALCKQKFLYPIHTPLSQRRVLIINRMGSKPARGEEASKSNRQIPAGSLPVLWLCNLLMKTGLQTAQEGYKQFFHMATMIVLFLNEITIQKEQKPHPSKAISLSILVQSQFQDTDQQTVPSVHLKRVSNVLDAILNSSRPCISESQHMYFKGSHVSFLHSTHGQFALVEYISLPFLALQALL